MSHDDLSPANQQSPTTTSSKPALESHDAGANAGATDQLFSRKTADSNSGGTVHTEWFVDYATVAGTSAAIPQRKNSQLIVDELKVFPKAVKYAKVLKGGNMAKSGAVFLGGVDVAPGNGDVSASVRYAPRSTFKVQVSLTDNAHANRAVAMNAKERQAIVDDIMSELTTRGDYDVLAQEKRALYQGRFEGKTLNIAIVPGGTAKDALAAATTKYSAPTDSRFDVSVVPQTSLLYRNSHDGERKTGGNTTSGTQQGVKGTQEVQSEKIKKLTTTVASAFSSKVVDSVKVAYKNLHETLEKKQDTTQHVEGTGFEWKLGIVPPPKEAAKPGTDDKKSTKDDDDGIIGKAEKIGNWIVSKGTGLVKKIPIIGTGIEVIGGIWDRLTTTASVNVGHTSKDETTTITGTPTDTKTGSEVNIQTDFVSEMATTISAQVATEINERVATRFGVETSSGTSEGTTDTHDERTSDHTEVLVHEVGDLKLDVKPRE